MIYHNCKNMGNIFSHLKIKSISVKKFNSNKPPVKFSHNFYEEKDLQPALITEEKPVQLPETTILEHIPYDSLKKESMSPKLIKNVMFGNNSPKHFKQDGNILPNKTNGFSLSPRLFKGKANEAIIPESNFFQSSGVARDGNASPRNFTRNGNNFDTNQKVFEKKDSLLVMKMRAENGLADGKTRPGDFKDRIEENIIYKRLERPKTLFPPNFEKKRPCEVLRKSIKDGCNCLKSGGCCNKGHSTQTSSWLPPVENWSAGTTGLPFGWESAVDKDGRTYYINHLTKTTTYEDPCDYMSEEPPEPRDVDLSRDPDMGFGFVAGSEKPVIVRFVTEGGPSVEKLLPGDQIWSINGEDVKKAPRDHVIALVRSCKENVSLIVCQPPLDNSARKSAILSAAKKQRLRNHPSRVRFAESVDINGLSPNPSHLSSSESTTPFMPNVLKVFLENGQTKSFKYDSSTTVNDVLHSLHQKMGIKRCEYFGLVVEHVKGLRTNKLTLLDSDETLSQIAARPGAQHLRCLYRLTFLPRDFYELLRQDSVAFEYLYLQCCKDVLYERVVPELKYDVVLKLCALHIRQHILSSINPNSKVSIKILERDSGLERFVPPTIYDSVKSKELRKLLSHFIKSHSGLLAPNQKNMTALQAKIHYLKILYELPSFGAKYFSILNTSNESVMLVSPIFGLSHLNRSANSVEDKICDIEQITDVMWCQLDDVVSQVILNIKHPDKEKLVVNLDTREAEELILVLQGYQKLLADKSLVVVKEESDKNVENDRRTAPPYHATHHVITNTWSYADGNATQKFPRIVDFTASPPYQNCGESTLKTKPKSKDQNKHGFDSNMNKTLSVYENSNGIGLGLLETHFDKDGTNTVRKIKQNGVFKESNLGPESTASAEKKNKENMIISDVETADAESLKSEYGKLKHSDSLILLTQGQKAAHENLLKNSCIESFNYSSESDSQVTPIPSPAHRLIPSQTTPEIPAMKNSGSSFGLHSPDNLPADFENPKSCIKDLIKEMEDKSGVQFNQGSLYLDSDLIDLTMIPPPATPDDDGPLTVLPEELNNPPTPFADRESLDNELRALEKDVGDLRLLTSKAEDTQHEYEYPEIFQSMSTVSDSLSEGMSVSDSEDSHSYSSLKNDVPNGATPNIANILLTRKYKSQDCSRDSLKKLKIQELESSKKFKNDVFSGDSLRKFRLTNPELLAESLKKLGNQDFTVESLKKLGINLQGQDIDAFIANLSIPPPPEGIALLQKYKTSEKIGTEYDINSFIIPPPPPNSQDRRSSDIIRRLYEAKECINRVVGNENSEFDACERDNDIDEVKVSSERVPKRLLTQSHVTSLQRKFEKQKQKEKNENNCFKMFNSLDNSKFISEYNSLENSSNSFNKLGNSLTRSLNSNLGNFDTAESSQNDEINKVSNHLDEVLFECDRLTNFDSHNFVGNDSLSNLYVMENLDGTLTGRIKNEDPPTNSSSLTVLERIKNYTQNFDEDISEKSSKKSFKRSNTFVEDSKNFQNGEFSSKSNEDFGLRAKSASQGDLISDKNSFDTETQHNGNISWLSNSDRPWSPREDSQKIWSPEVQPNMWSPKKLNVNSKKSWNNSKQSVGSSNDSLTSNSSQNTVLSASVKSLDQENDVPPQLPPRKSDKVTQKPPIPKSPLQDSRMKQNSKEINDSDSQVSIQPQVPIRLKSSTVNFVPLPQKTTKISPSKEKLSTEFSESTEPVSPAKRFSKNRILVTPNQNIQENIIHTTQKKNTVNCSTKKNDFTSSNQKCLAANQNNVSPNQNNLLPNQKSLLPNQNSVSSKVENLSNTPKKRKNVIASEPDFINPDLVQKPPNKVLSNGVDNQSHTIDSSTISATLKKSGDNLSSNGSKSWNNQKETEKQSNKNSSLSTRNSPNSTLTTRNNSNSTLSSCNSTNSIYSTHNSPNFTLSTRNSSPNLPPKPKLLNGKIHRSLDSVDPKNFQFQFEEDSLDECDDIERMLPASRTAYKSCAVVVSNSLNELSVMIQNCSDRQNGSCEYGFIDENLFYSAKNFLTSEARQFVTASKLFVKSTTESETILLTCLNSCLDCVEKMVSHCEEIAKHTPTPTQTENVITKVKDVVNAYVLTVKAALCASGRSLEHPSMGILMTQATNLAAVLTTLMKTLKVFSP